ncbi:MAG: hypothetical protein ACTHPO_06970 [Alphaproteobacteria bacterium]
MTTDLKAVYTWWRNEGQALGAERKDLALQRSALQADLDALNDEKAGYNPFKFLKNAWRRATVGSNLQGQINALKDKQTDLEASLRNQADAQAVELFYAYLQSSAADAVTVNAYNDNVSAFGVADKTYTTLEKINSKTNDVLRAVDRAWDECDDAQDYETLDMFASNAFATVISHAETEEAAEYLADAVEAIKDYSEYMEKVKGEPYMVEANIDIDDILSTAEWDLWFGVFDLDVLSFFSSWQNHTKLEEAKTQLEDVKAHIEPISESLSTRMKASRAEKLSYEDKNRALCRAYINGLELPSDMRASLSLNVPISRAVGSAPSI